jgi:hypothetical protein
MAFAMWLFEGPPDLIFLRVLTLGIGAFSLVMVIVSLAKILG